MCVWGVEHLGVRCGAAIATSSHALHINLKAFAVPRFSRGIWWKLKYERCRPLYTIVFPFPIFKFLIPLFPLLHIYIPAKLQGSRKAAPHIIIKWCFLQVRLSERRKHQAGRWRQFLHCRVTVLHVGWNLTIHSSLLLMLLVKLTPSQGLPVCLHLVWMAPWLQELSPLQSTGCRSSVGGRIAELLLGKKRDEQVKKTPCSQVDKAGGEQRNHPG